MSEDAVINLDQQIQEETSSDTLNTEDASSLSFEDLDTLTSNEGEISFDSISEGYVEKKAETNEQSTEGDGDGEKIEASSEEVEEKVENEAETEQDASEEIKKIIGLYKDENIELAADTKFKHKVDGQEIDVGLQELLNNYSGKVSYERKFQELANNKKEFESFKESYDKDIEDIYTVLTSFKESMQNKDALGALRHFAAFAGMQPYEFKQEMIRSLAPEVMRMSNLSEEQLQYEKLQAENEYLRFQQESEQAKSKYQQSQQELIKEIQRIQEAHGISNDDFALAYNELKESDYQGTIDANAVAAFYRGKIAISKADNILREVNPTLINDNTIVESLQKVILENPDFDDNDLIDIVNEVYGKVKEDTSKILSKKATPKQKENVKPPKSKQQDILDWDEL